MKFAIIENHLKGLGKARSWTVEGLTNKVNALTAEMCLPPFSDGEMKALARQFCEPSAEPPVAEMAPETETSNKPKKRARRKAAE
ncbi:MAG: hypothetical protein LBR65_03875 [Culturomica sp.]|jgi:hypothetical protein|nr:hypothetical protein [Culturomica sp.]